MLKFATKQCKLILGVLGVLVGYFFFWDCVLGVFSIGVLDIGIGIEMKHLVFWMCGIGCVEKVHQLEKSKAPALVAMDSLFRVELILDCVMLSGNYACIYSSFQELKASVTLVKHSGNDI